MNKFQEYVLPFLKNSTIKYLAAGKIKVMSVEYFLKSFTSIAAKELYHTGQHYWYYQNKENPDLVMCFRLSQPADLFVTILLYKDYEKQFSELSSQ